MSRAPVNDPERMQAHGRLMSTLADLAESGRRIPCTGSNSAAWTAEDDPEAAAFSAAQCAACPALRACREYVDAFPEPTGTWAGLTTADRAPRRGRPKKEQNR